MIQHRGPRMETNGCTWWSRVYEWKFKDCGELLFLLVSFLQYGKEYCFYHSSELCFHDFELIFILDLSELH